MQAAYQDKSFIVLELPGSEVFEIRGQEQTLLQKGHLQILDYSDLNLYVLVLNSFRYSLSKEITVMTTDEPMDQRLYVLPNIGSFYGIRCSGNNDALEIFEGILREKTNLIGPPEGQTARPEDSQSSKTAVEKGKTSTRVSEFLYDFGDKARGGIMELSSKMGEQIEKGGQYLTTKIKKNEREEKISDETKEKFKMANKGTKTVLDVTKATLEGIFDVCKTVGKYGVQTFEKSETGKKVTSHKNYEGTKDVCRAGIHAVSAVLNGMDEALCTLAKSSGYAITDVVAHKYGKDAGEVAKDGLEAAGQIGKVFNAPEDVVVASMAEATKKKGKN